MIKLSNYDNQPMYVVPDTIAAVSTQRKFWGTDPNFITYTEILLKDGSTLVCNETPTQFWELMKSEEERINQSCNQKRES